MITTTLSTLASGSIPDMKIKPKQIARENDKQADANSPMPNCRLASEGFVSKYKATAKNIASMVALDSTIEANIWSDDDGDK